jgi:hypothetical protein
MTPENTICKPEQKYIDKIINDNSNSEKVNNKKTIKNNNKNHNQINKFKNFFNTLENNKLETQELIRDIETKMTDESMNTEQIIPQQQNNKFRTSKKIILYGLGMDAYVNQLPLVRTKLSNLTGKEIVIERLLYAKDVNNMPGIKLILRYDEDYEALDAVSNWNKSIFDTDVKVVKIKLEYTLKIMINNAELEYLNNTLDKYGIIKIDKLNRDNMRHQRRKSNEMNNNIIFIEFDSSESYINVLRSGIELQSRNVEAKLHVKKMMQCTHCWKGKHLAKWCNKKHITSELCSNCGKQVHELSNGICVNTMKCSLCGDVNHNSLYTLCPVRTRETRKMNMHIIELLHVSGIAFDEHNFLAGKNNLTEMPTGSDLSMYINKKIEKFSAENNLKDIQNLKEQVDSNTQKLHQHEHRIESTEKLGAEHAAQIKELKSQSEVLKALDQNVKYLVNQSKKQNMYDNMTHQYIPMMLNMNHKHHSQPSGKRHHGDSYYDHDDIADYSSDLNNSTPRQHLNLNTMQPPPGRYRVSPTHNASGSIQTKILSQNIPTASAINVNSQANHQTQNKSKQDTTKTTNNKPTSSQNTNQSAHTHQQNVNSNGLSKLDNNKDNQTNKELKTNVNKKTTHGSVTNNSNGMNGISSMTKSVSSTNINQLSQTKSGGAMHQC